MKNKTSFLKVIILIVILFLNFTYIYSNDKLLSKSNSSLKTEIFFEVNNNNVEYANIKLDNLELSENSGFYELNLPFLIEGIDTNYENIVLTYNNFHKIGSKVLIHKSKELKSVTRIEFKCRLKNIENENILRIKSLGGKQSLIIPDVNLEQWKKFRLTESRNKIINEFDKVMVRFDENILKTYLDGNNETIQKRNFTELNYNNESNQYQLVFSYIKEIKRNKISKIRDHMQKIVFPLFVFIITIIFDFKSSEDEDKFKLLFTNLVLSLLVINLILIGASFFFIDSLVGAIITIILYITTIAFGGAVIYNLDSYEKDEESSK